MPQDTDEKPIKMSKKMIIIAAVVLAIAALIPAGYFFIKYQHTQKILSNPTDAAAEEIRTLTADVGKIYEIPKTETPTIATVADKDKLSGQAFFANAQNGDKVLVFSQAKRAILYRPSTKKIIEVAPINVNNTPQAQATTPDTPVVGAATPAPTPTIASMKYVIRNGTEVTGLSRKYETILKEKIPSAQVTDRDNAQTTSFAKTIVIDVSGTKATQATAIAQALKIEVSNLPTGETKPNADFLIIVGADNSSL